MKILCQLQEKQLQTVGSYKFIQMFNSFINYKFHFFPCKHKFKKADSREEPHKNPIPVHETKHHATTVTNYIIIHLPYTSNIV